MFGSVERLHELESMRRSIAMFATIVGCDTSALITAITNANASGRGTLDLSAGCMYALTSAPYSDGYGPDALPVISGSITIHGDGATIKGNQSARLLQVGSNGSITADHLTFSGGDDMSGYGGGAILNANGVSLTDVTVSDDSTVGSGGAIYNIAGTATLTNSSVSDNDAGGEGGALVNLGTLVMTDCEVSDNSASSGDGGAIANRGGSGGGMLTLIDTTMTGNHGTGGSGGGLYNGGGVATVTDSTISGNTASDFGGGLYNYSGTATMTDSTVSGNNSADGGGIYNESQVILTNTTVASNTANSGGGISNEDSVTLANSIIGDNSPQDCTPGTITDDGYNLDSDGTCKLNASTDKPDTDPQLGPLQANGGPTATMALESTSPAIDAIPVGTNECGTSITTDQRGVLRPQGSGCDIGAYEYGDIAMQSIAASPNPVPTLTKLTYTATVINAGGAKAQGVRVTDTLPIGEKLKSATASRGSCSVSASTVTCTLGKMSAATLATVTIVVKVKAPSGSMLSDTASVNATIGDTGFGDQSLTVDVSVS